jgi:hypothetical protein
MTSPRFCAGCQRQTRTRLGLAWPALVVIFSLLPALSPVASAEDELTFEPGSETACESTVQQSSAASAIVASQGDNTNQCAPDLQFGNTGNLEPAPAAPPASERPDGDGDGLYDDDELEVYGTDPSWWDTDGDGAGDGAEVYYGTDPLAG